MRAPFAILGVGAAAAAAVLLVGHPCSWHMVERAAASRSVPAALAAPVAEAVERTTPSVAMQARLEAPRRAPAVTAPQARPERRAPYARRDVQARDEAEREVVATARAIEAAWEAGEGARAAELLAAPDAVMAWHEVGCALRIDARFPGDDIELRLSRVDAGPALAVAFPPGTYGDFGDRRHQDLTLLRAPVIVVRDGELDVCVRVPVACASFHRRAPARGSGCELRRFPAGSCEEQLVARLCEGTLPPLDAPAQLAVWTVTQDRLRDLSELEADPSFTFATNERVTAAHARAAATLVAEAGLASAALPGVDVVVAEATSASP